MGGNVLWFLDEINGAPWPIELGTTKTEPRLSADERGITLLDERRIVIDATEPLSVQDETTFHERMHAQGFPRHMTIRKEESVICKLSPGIWQSLRRLGFRWPRRPAGWRQRLWLT